jgi:hypothetical protein
VIEMTVLAAPTDRHPAPAVQIKGLPRQAPVLDEEPDELEQADEVCDPSHFAPRWWPATDAE